MIFVLRQLQEKCRVQKMGLHAAFVDLTKALILSAVMDCGKSWRALAVPPPPFLIILRQLHEGQ